MVWAGISSLMAHRYIMEVLEDHVMHFMTVMDEYVILMQDNTRPHSARVVKEYLIDMGIRRFD